MELHIRDVSKTYSNDVQALKLLCTVVNTSIIMGYYPTRNRQLEVGR